MNKKYELGDIFHILYYENEMDQSKSHWSIMSYKVVDFNNGLTVGKSLYSNEIINIDTETTTTYSSISELYIAYCRKLLSDTFLFFDEVYSNKEKLSELEANKKKSIKKEYLLMQLEKLSVLIKNK